MNQTISKCGPEDFGDVCALVNAAYRGEGGVSGWTSEVGLVAGPRITISALTEDLASSAQTSFLALRQGGELVACVRREYLESPSKIPLCHISMLAVHPRVQDRGFGRILLRHAEVQGQRAGARAVRLTVVSVRDSLIAWYERQGYVRTGEKGIPYQDVRFGTPLRSDLEFVWLEKTLDANTHRRMTSCASRLMAEGSGRSTRTTECRADRERESLSHRYFNGRNVSSPRYSSPRLGTNDGFTAVI